MHQYFRYDVYNKYCEVDSYKPNLTIVIYHCHLCVCVFVFVCVSVCVCVNYGHDCPGVLIAAPGRYVPISEVIAAPQVQAEAEAESPQVELSDFSWVQVTSV